MTGHDGVRPGTRAAVITASNRSARGERPDDSGRLLADRLRELGCEVGDVTVVPDDVEAIRLAARDRVPTSVLSRGLAGTIGTTLVVNLPGSPGGVKDGVAVLAPILGHVLSQLHGGDHVPGGGPG